MDFHDRFESTWECLCRAYYKNDQILKLTEFGKYIINIF